MGFHGEPAPLWDQRSCSQEEGPEILQGTVLLGDIKNINREEGTARPQGMFPLGDRWSHSQEQGPERHQKVVPLNNSKKQSQEEIPERPQGTVILGSSRSHDQEGGTPRPQVTLLGGSRCHGMRENPKKQQHQGQKAKQPKVKRTLESQHQKMSALHCSSGNWDCPWCKVMNFSWCKTCYKCNKVCTAVESGDMDSEKTH